MGTMNLAVAIMLALAAPPRPAPPGPLAAALARVATIFPDELWNVEQLRWDPAMLLAAADLVDARARAEQATAAWREGHVVFIDSKYNPPGQRRVVGIGAVRLASPAAARGYLGLLIDLKREVDQKLNQPLKSSRSQALTLRAAEEGVRIDRELILAGGTIAAETTLLLRHGDLVVEFLWKGMPADLAWAEAVFKSLRRAAR